MSRVRFGSVVAIFLLATTCVSAATPKEIEAAIQQGAGYLKDLYKGATPKQVVGGANGLGAAALAGLALLESGVPSDDASVRAITAGVRDASFTATQTYHIALAMLYLDRLGDSTDVPLIQMLAVRLLAGQSPNNGGWSYDCIDSVSVLDERELRTSLLTTELTTGNKPATAPAAPGKRPPPVPGKTGISGQLLPEVAKYQGRLAAVRSRPRITDNSNTQFGVLGTWVARKHGVPVEAALDLIEARFMNSQTTNGGWPYAGTNQGSPSMTCAGLLGLATAIGRREERRMRAEVAKPEVVKPAAPPKTNPGEPQKPKNEDPFFNPPTEPKPNDPFFDQPKLDPPKPSATPRNPPEAKPAAKPVRDARDQAVQNALTALGTALAGKGRGPRFNLNGAGQLGQLGDRDLYFLWSVERVGVIYGLEKIGGVDWYEVGAEELVAAQNITGSWGRGGRGSEVDTAFALLFLSRSNLVHDLSNRVQHGMTSTELRAGGGPTGGNPTGGNPPVVAAPTRPPGDAPVPSTKPNPGLPELDQPEPRKSANVIVIKPGASTSEDPKKLAKELIAAMGLEWDSALTKVRQGKGSEYTQALVFAIARLDGDRLKLAREALAERLTRMTAETLRDMAKSDETELRRAAVLAMAMKDDKKFIPDLVAAILDDEELVVRAAKAGLKSLTGQDFGPSAGATSVERKAVVEAWREWLKNQKK